MTYSLIDRLADIGTPTAEEAIVEIAAKDALIRELVGEMKFIRKMWPGTGVAHTAHAALTRAKEAGYE